MVDYGLIDKSEVEQLELIRTSPIDENIFVYKEAGRIIEYIVAEFYTKTDFCCKYRIYKNLLKLLYVDLVRFYRICYYCLGECSNKLCMMNLQQTKELYEIYQSFIILTENTRKYIDIMASQIKEPLPATLTYFKVLLFIINRKIWCSQEQFKRILSAKNNHT